MVSVILAKPFWMTNASRRTNIVETGTIITEFVLLHYLFIRFSAKLYVSD